jgi:hypothetical protein
MNGFETLRVAVGWRLLTECLRLEREMADLRERIAKAHRHLAGAADLAASFFA